MSFLADIHPAFRGEAHAAALFDAIKVQEFAELKMKGCFRYLIRNCPLFQQKLRLFTPQSFKEA